MKFVHIADMHFDMPFTVLSNNDLNLGNERRMEQRLVFKEIINYIKENNIEFLFIAGDLYEHQYVNKTTIEYINNLFKEIPNTKIFITPGNHDPLLQNSYYNTFDWNDNVHIFTNEIGIYEYENIDVYGYGFNDFYLREEKINKINIKNKEKINVLITHGSLEGGEGEDREYNPLSKKELEALGFDYIALGHIHKKNYSKQENKKIIYPGSLMALGFDELGEHGMIVGNIEKNKLSLEFIPLDKKEFKKLEIDVSEINFEEKLIEKINNINLEENIYYKIILIGEKNIQINLNNIKKYLINKNIIKLKNNTKIKYDLEKISNENNLRGIFVKELLNIKNSENEDIIKNAIELGLDSLK
ncbi:MAG: metallophosphoesterase [Clostridia bacterium]|nr:metallophosphoesterase [Clostridia bacterium]